MPRLLRHAAVLAFLVAILGLLILRQVELERSAGRSIGIILDPGEAPVCAEVSAGLPADLAGFEGGDRILQVGPHIIQTRDGYLRAAAGFARGRQVVFRVRRAAEELTLTVVPGVPTPWVRSLVDALATLCFAGLAILAFTQVHHEPRGRLLTIYASTITLGLALPLELSDFPRFEVFVFPLYVLLVGLEIGLELHLASSIPQTQPWRLRLPWVVPAFYAVGIGLGVLLAATLLEFYAETSYLPWDMALAEILFWDVGMSFWAIALVFLLARAALTWPRPLGRQQAALVLVGALPWATLILARVIFGTMLARDVAWVEIIDPFVLLFFPVAVFVAIFRYRLFDLEMVVKRSLVFTVLSGALVLVFYLAIAMVGAVLATWLPGAAGSRWAMGAAFLAMGLLFSPLRRACHRLIEKRFFPERRALRGHLIRLSRELPARGNVASMGSELVTRLQSIFGLEKAVLLLAEGHSGLLVPVESRGVETDITASFMLSAGDAGGELLRSAGRPLEAASLGEQSAELRRKLERIGVELLVPLVRRDQLVGLLALGPKEFGEPFGAEEKELLSLLSHHVASVFENARLFESATRDSLTGLLRREAILERLEQELRRAERFDRDLTVGMADIDHFKGVNDRFGHLVGDLMLKQVATALSRNLRTTDVVGRYGGEEFLIILTETDLDGALTVADKMRAAVASIELRSQEDATTHVTVSIGLAGRRQLGDNIEKSALSLIDLADRALYAAKSAGRNRVDRFQEVGDLA